jgi:hypothetical protein
VPAKTGSRGQLRGQITGSCDDYGIDDGSVSIIIRTLMAMRQETPVHWIDMVAGVLLFAETQRDSGVIYVYDKKGRVFWGLNFDEGWDADGNQLFARHEFEELAQEYGLTDYAARPSLLAPLAKFTKASRGRTEPGESQHV